jgi:hypothetical protein
MTSNLFPSLRSISTSAILMASALACGSAHASGPPELRTVLICTVALADAPPNATAAQVEGTLFTNSKTIDGAWRAASYGQIGLQLGNGNGMDPTVELVLPENLAYWNERGSSALRSRMAQELAKLGYNTSSSSYDHVLYIQPSAIVGGAPAWATYGGNTTVYKSFGFYAAMHEMGHNLGLNHSASDFDDNGDWEGAYNDESCTMGGANDTYNACKKVKLGWLDAFPGTVTTLTSSGTHTLVPVNHHPDTVPGERVVIIPNLPGGAIYVSYRLTGPAPYNTLSTNTSAHVSLHRLPTPDGISRVLGYYDEGEVFVNEGNGVRITVDNIAEDKMSAQVTIDVGYEWIQGGNPAKWDDPANWAGGVLPPENDVNAIIMFGPAATGNIAGASVAGDEKVTLRSLRWESSFQWDAFGEEGQPTTTGIFVNTGSPHPASAVAVNGATLTTNRVPWNLESDLRVTGNGQLIIQASGADGVRGPGGFIVEAGNQLTFGSTSPPGTYNYSYTGGVRILDGGVVDVNSDNGALGTGGITIAEGGSLELTNGTFSNNAEFVVSSDGSSNAFLSGSAAISINGAFTFNLQAANSAVGSTWQIVDPAMTATYGPSFSVTGFTKSGGVWTGTVMGNTYSFNESTGVLRCDATSRIVYNWTQAGTPTKWDAVANWAGGVVPPTNDTNTVIDFGLNVSGSIGGSSTAGSEKVTVRSLRWERSFTWDGFGEYSQTTTTGIFVNTGTTEPAFAVMANGASLYASYVPWNLDSDLVLTGDGKLTIRAFGNNGINGPGGFIVESGTTLQFNSTHGSSNYSYTGGVTIRDGGLVNIGSSNGALGNGLVTIDQGGELRLTSDVMDNVTRFVVERTGASAASITGGSATFTGSFNFDLAGVGAEAGTTWQIVDPGMSATYGTGFSVVGFTEASGVWAGFVEGSRYRFDMGTGMLICDGVSSADPAFIADPIVAAAADVGIAYTGKTIAGSAIDLTPGDTLSYSKTSGPAWLTVAANGALAGTPGFNDIGQNSFTVHVQDSNGGSDIATLVIDVFGLRAVGSAQNYDSNSATATNTIPNFTVAPGENRKLVAVFCWESAETLTGIQYGTQSFVPAVVAGNGREVEIWYLDNPTVGTANIVATYSAPELSRMTVVSLVNARPGDPVCSNTAVGGGTTAITLNTPAAHTFVIGAYLQNGTSDSGFANPFGTTLFRDNCGSCFGLAGHRTEADAGIHTYSFAGGAGDGSIALAGFLHAGTVDPYQEWLAANFTQAELNDPNVSGLDGDPDGDRLANLAEYGLGLDPRAFEGMDTISRYEDVSGTNSWVFTMRKYSGRSDVNVYLKRSLNLEPGSWQTIARVLNGGTLEVFDGASIIEQSGSNPELLRVRQPLDGEPKAFYRWVVERPEP